MNPPTSRIIIQHQTGEVLGEFRVGPGEHGVGRDATNAISAESDYLSRHHARLIISAGGMTIEDLGSTHGTFVNGVAVQTTTTVGLNQPVKIGDLFLTVQTEAAVETTADNYRPGDLVGGGRYTLQGEIGRGGGGVVWLAQDEHLQQQIAIKRLPTELADDPVAFKDLISEVQKARLLSHPNIIRIHDFVKLPNEAPFVTMEFVDGADLNTLRGQQPGGYFTWARLEGLALQLCEALNYAHQQHIIHRDLKPANMMITRDGNLKLADFGIAVSVADNVPRDTTQGDSSGTMVYMSPQQMQGAPPHLTDDIYALGSTLYDLLTTRPPFYTGDLYQLTQEVPPIPLSQRLTEFNLENQVPPHVENAIMVCLHKDRAQRPATAADLATLLHPGDQPPPPPPPPSEFIPDLESVLAEPLEKTQKYLAEKLPEPVTSWLKKQNTSKRDFVILSCLVIGLLAVETIYSGLKHNQDFFKTFKEKRFFQPW